jgi:uncharacterized membrane protein YeaQ/YmgE (transglycosylase-associated protein family)
LRISFKLLQEARRSRDALMRFDPTTTFLLVLLIGAVIGVVFDRFGGRGWFARQVTGGRNAMITGALVGIAGAFIGYHLEIMLRLGTGGMQLIAAAVGALVVLLLWRTVR